MGNLYATVLTTEPIYEGKMKVDGDAVRECSLTRINLSSAENGMYFCTGRSAHFYTHHHCLTNTSSRLLIQL